MIAIAAVFGGISIFAADWWINNATNARVDALSASLVRDAKPEVKFNTIVVASESMEFGVALERAKLHEIHWPQDALPEGSFARIDNVFEKGERVVVAPIVKNEPILLSKLSGPDGKAALSNLVEPGMRAVSVKVDEVAGVGGFITPGDRVDVVLTRESEAAGDGATRGEMLASQIVLENIKVLSVGQDANEKSADPQLVNSATLEVTSEGARKIALARSVGSLSLSLRSPADQSPIDPKVTTVRDFNRMATDQLVTSSSTVEEAIENAGPLMTTVVVTRGSTETKIYEVLSNN